MSGAPASAAGAAASKAGAGATGGSETAAAAAAAAATPVVGSGAVHYIRELKGPKALRQFQAEAALSHTRPLALLLQLLALPNHELHSNLLTHLRSKLLSHIEHLDEATRGRLLLQVFPYVRLDELRPISMALLDRQQEIPGKILSYLKNDRALLATCSLHVKQQMWAFDTDVFKDALLPVLHACVTEANQLWENFDATLNQQLWPSPPTESASAQELLEMVGAIPKLQSYATAQTQSLYKQTQDPMYCWVRLQLAAALHKQSVPPEGLNGNVVRAFDAICRNTGVNESHWKEISDAAKEMRNLTANPAAAEEFRMLLKCPYFYWALSQRLLENVENVVATYVLPSLHNNLGFCMELLDLYERLQVNPEGATPSNGIPVEEMRSIIHEALPAFASLVADDKINEKHSLLHTDKDVRVSFADDLQPFMADYSFLRNAIMLYVIRRAQAHDIVRATQFVPDILGCEVDMSLLRPFTSLLMHLLIGQAWESYSYHAPQVLSSVLVPLAQHSLQLHALVIEMCDRVPGQPARLRLEKQLMELAAKGALSATSHDEDEAETDNAPAGKRAKLATSDSLYHLYERVTEKRDRDFRSRLLAVLDERRQRGGQPLAEVAEVP